MPYQENTHHFINSKMYFTSKLTWDNIIDKRSFVHLFIVIYHAN